MIEYHLRRERGSTSRSNNALWSGQARRAVHTDFHDGQPRRPAVKQRLWHRSHGSTRSNDWLVLGLHAADPYKSAGQPPGCIAPLPCPSFVPPDHGQSADGRCEASPASTLAVNVRRHHSAAEVDFSSV